MEPLLVRLARGLTTLQMRQRLKRSAKVLASVQRPTRGDNVFIFASPRSGSTWLMELILSQPGFRACDEPLNLRNPDVRCNLGITAWHDLYQREAEARIERYFQAICDGRISAFTQPWKHYRPVTHRLVFKILHGCEDRIDWVRGRFGGQVVLLIRHPVAVTVSRKELPRLEAFVGSDYARWFDPATLELARRIIVSGSFFEKGILHWCFENAVPLRAAQPDWTIITYEQLVVEPARVLGFLTARLDLPDVKRMMRQVDAASGTVSKSNEETRALVAAGGRNQLISKWRRYVDEEGERVAFEILDAFGIKAYVHGRDMPDERYLVGHSMHTPEPSRITIGTEDDTLFRDVEVQP